MPIPESTDHTAQVQALFVRHSAALRGFVSSLMSQFGAVDDVLHDTFLTITAKAAGFELGTNFLAWAKAIARFKVLHARRAHWREMNGISDEAIEALCASEPEAEAAPLERQLAALAGCIEALPRQTRRAVELRYQQAHSVPEAAQRLGWTVGSLYVILFRARAMLRECIERKLVEAV
ncbi:MAG: sigma-70 family RNA polymerase sigma factor [Chthoniobacteraceae bacterium]